MRIPVGRGPRTMLRHGWLARSCLLLAVSTAFATAARAQSYTFSHLAGVLGEIAGGSADGTGSAAGFYSPVGVAVDGAGTMYVADTGNHTIRKVTAAGVVTTLAGLAGTSGSADGTGSAARFLFPSGVAVDGAGTVYVADTYNHTIRKVTAAGVVTTLGVLAAARPPFFYPRGVAVDGAGTVYVADSMSHTIWTVTAAGVVTTLAGGGTSGSADGTGSAARFDTPYGVAVDGAGTVYVADWGNHTIRKVTAAGVVTTLAGLAGTPGIADGTGSAARFFFPSGVAVDGAGTVYVADSMSHTIRKVTAAGVVTTLAGLARTAGSADGTGSAARFSWPRGVAVDGAGTVYVADSQNHAIRLGVPDLTGLDSDSDTLLDSWESSFGLDRFSAVGDEGAAGDPDHDGVNNAAEQAAGTHPRGVASATRYFAEGATGPFFETRLGLANPEATSVAHVLLRFLDRTGTETTHVLRVPAQESRTVTVGTLPGLATREFSTVVESDVPIVADRLMVWDRTSRYGSHLETAVRAPALRWYLAEGATHSGFDLFYLLQNATATAADVRVRYLLPRGAPLEKRYTVGARSRFNIWVDLEQIPEGSGQLPLANTDVSAVIEVLNDVPIVVERAMYFSGPGQPPFNAGHDSAGVTEPATRWVLAEGSTQGHFFDTFVLVANPHAQDAKVEGRYLLGDGTVVVKAYTVRATSRFNIWVNYEDSRLANAAVSTVVTSTNGVPIVVERAMWWPGTSPTGWYEGHSSPGTPVTGTAWGMASGTVTNVGAASDTYLLVANTSAADADVQVTLLFDDGTVPVSRTFHVLGHSRFTVSVRAAFPEAVGKRFGAVVEALGAAPPAIVVECAVYSDAPGVFWAAGGNALATRLR